MAEITQTPLTPAERRRALEFVAYRRRYGGQVLWFEPYVKQQEFFRAGATKRERLLIAGNQNGKTISGAFEAALHATGKYPVWWKGKRFTNPTKGWCCGETSLAARDIQQKKLCGEPGVDVEYGTGMIGKDDLIDKSLARGVTDAYDSVQVRHITGGVSIIRFKSYEQGRAKFQGESLDWIWFDEEPPEDVYAEGLTRTAATGGIAFMTFTPLKGRSSVVIRFLGEPSDDRAVTMMTIDDALHIPPAEREKIIAGYLPHEREARARGVPMLGSGRIFQTEEVAITEQAIDPDRIPPFWVKIWGIDIGIGHPFAAVLMLWDKDLDVVHIHATIRMSNTLPIVHAQRMRAAAASVPVAWPKDAGDREHSTGEPVSKLYKAHGLNMLPEHATWPNGGYSTEAGIMEWDEREKMGKLKVAAHLSEWLEERRIYHRKDGLIVKMNDDLMSATRIALMMKRFARNVPMGPVVGPRYGAGSGIAKGTDFDVFGAFSNDDISAIGF